MSLQVSTRWQRGRFTLHAELELPLDGVTALFGRSGCGKTSLLRVIAGLERAPDSRVQFGTRVWQQGRTFVPLHKRRIGLVFQEPSLLPNLSARDNMLYGYRRTPPAQRRLQPDDVCTLLEIHRLLDRPIDTLSGGERQRIALGRALLSNPQLLLLDEPLSALDTPSKREIMPFLSRLAGETGVPVVLVTHAADEVERLADRIVFMRDGEVERVETLAAALSRSDSPLFADDGAASVLLGRPVAADRSGLRCFAIGSDQLWAPGKPTELQHQPTRLRIPARDVVLSLQDPQQISIQNHLPVTVERIDALAGERCLVATRTADEQLLLAEVTQWAVQQLGLQPGQNIYALIKSVALMN